MKHLESRRPQRRLRPRSGMGTSPWRRRILVALAVVAVVTAVYVVDVMA